MPSIDLAYCMSLPPELAVAYFKRKGYAFSWDWHDVWQDAQAQAFTVAKVTKLDILQDIRDAVDKAISEGKTFKWFEKELTPILQKKGWWGKALHTDQDTGEISEVQLGSPHRLKTIFSVNMQTAYQAGRWQSQIENVDDRPYWQLVAIRDDRTRPSHAAVDGVIYRWDDPIWAWLYPPNGWRCRCRVITLTEAEASVREIHTYVAGEPLPLQPDEGWAYNPGAAAWVPDVSRYTGDLARLAKQELRT